MSVMRDPLATPSRLLGLLKYVVNRGGRADRKDVLRAILAPASLGDQEHHDGAKFVATALEECLAAGLLLADGDEFVLPPRHEWGIQNPARFIARLPVTMVDHLFAEGNNGNEDLGRVIAWYLAQDPLDPPADGRAIDRAITDQGVNDLLDVNTERLNQFDDWICYLGLAWRSGTQLIPDPTGQLRLRLEALFEGKREMSLRHFMTNAADAVPVLDGGRLRAMVEPHGKVPQSERDHVSPATSLALLRLRDEGEIELSAGADDAQMMVLSEGRTAHRFSTIKRGPRRAPEARQ